MASRCANCASSTAAALHRIFIAPSKQPLLISRRIVFVRPHQKLQHPRGILPQQQQQRSYAFKPAKKTRAPRDEEITYDAVRLVSEDNKLSAPQSTSSILATLDRKTHTLVLVAIPPPASSSPSPPSQAFPIVKIQSKAALHAASKASQKKKPFPSTILKTIELNWAIDAHDLAHRMQRVREFLLKGWRVDILMAGKKRGRQAGGGEAEEVLKKVREVVGGVEGAREWKVMEGVVGKAVTVHVEGKAA